MNAEIPGDGRISYAWLFDILQKYYDDPEMNAGIAGVIYHLRHLGLLNEEKIVFDMDEDEELEAFEK